MAGPGQVYVPGAGVSAATQQFAPQSTNTPTFAQLVGGGQAGNLAWTSDQGLCVWTGNVWQPVSGNTPNFGYFPTYAALVAAFPPASTQTGSTAYAADVAAQVVNNGTIWATQENSTINLSTCSASPASNDRYLLFGGQETSVWAANGLYNMLYTAGSGILSYRSCSLSNDPTVAANWSAAVSCIGGGNGGESGVANHSYVLLYNGTLYCAYNQQSTSNIYLATAAVSAPTTWTNQGQIVAHSSIGGSSSGNTCLVPPGPGTGGNFLLFIEYEATNTFPTEGVTNSWQISLWSAPSITGTYTEVLSQISSLRSSPNGSASGPQAILTTDQYGNSIYVMYYHSATWGRIGPTDIYRATIPAANIQTDGWTLTNGNPSNNQDCALLRRSQYYEFDQTADPEVFQNPNTGATYLFYTAANNRTGSWFNLMVTPLISTNIQVDGAKFRPIWGVSGERARDYWNGTTGDNKVVNVPFVDPTGSAITGTWALDYSVTGAPIGVGRFNSSNAQNDSIAFDVKLSPGTYSLTVAYQKSANGAINTVRLGSSPSASAYTLGTIDTYAASTSNTGNSVITFTILGFTEYQWTMFFTAPTRNASSSGWRLEDFGWCIQRTSPN